MNHTSMFRLTRFMIIVSVFSMMFVLRCLYNVEVISTRPGALPQERSSQQHKTNFPAEKEIQYVIKIRNLEKQLLKYKNILTNAPPFGAQDKTIDFEKYVHANLKTTDIVNGVSLRSEYEDVAFNRFNINRIYLVDPGLGKRVVEKPIGFKKRDLMEVILHAMQSLNARRRREQSLYTVEHFIEGLYRVVPTIGAQYELYFSDIDNLTTPRQGYYIRVTVLRPFGPLLVHNTKQFSTKMDQINLIVPLSGRVETLKLFLKHFVQVCVSRDRNVFLTLVYFGVDGLAQVKSLLADVTTKHDFDDIKLITLNESFSRGRGLQAGAQSWTRGDVLLFLCDVDIVFSMDFLERCRMNAVPKKRVYYPMVFSLYSPHVVYSLHDSDIPLQQEQLVISKETGFWRDFGYGMTCQYLSDFNAIGGFSEDIRGWGGEDVLLYRKYIRSTMLVVRATDPGIFHLWHEKKCDPELSSDQYRSCIRSKALNEASHAQLGMLAFKNEVDLHRSYKKRLETA